MKESPELRTLRKLVVLRLERLDRLREDLLRLRQITEQARATLDERRACERAFLDDSRKAETGGVLDAHQMVETRHYLRHLQSQREAAEKMLAEVSGQDQSAQRAFDEAYAEVRTLQRLAERRRMAERETLQRAAYGLADDEELARQSRVGNAYAEY